jgi:hypothetical protein
MWSCGLTETVAAAGYTFGPFQAFIPKGGGARRGATNGVN